MLVNCFELFVAISSVVVVDNGQLFVAICLWSIVISG
jgi:hypothetical protein